MYCSEPKQITMDFIEDFSPVNPFIPHAMMNP